MKLRSLRHKQVNSDPFKAAKGSSKTRITPTLKRSQVRNIESSVSEAFSSASILEAKVLFKKKAPLKAKALFKARLSLK